jgi:hypothetical protein
MTGVGFKPSIPLFERAKTAHALDRASAVIGTGLTTKGNEVIARLPTITDKNEENCQCHSCKIRSQNVVSNSLNLTDVSTMNMEMENSPTFGILRHIWICACVLGTVNFVTCFAY